MTPRPHPERTASAARRAPLVGVMLAMLASCDPDPVQTDVDQDTDAPTAALTWSVHRDADPLGMFMSAWGTGASDVWIVGGQPDEGVLLRGGPGGLDPIDLPEGTPMLNWVHGTSASDVWLAGLRGTLLHWDGSTFTSHSQDVPEAFWGVHAAEGQVLAVGGPFRAEGQQPILYHHDGTEWASLPIPSELSPSGLFKAHHDGSLFQVVGAEGTALSVAHDGTTAPVATGTGIDLITLHRAEGDAGSRLIAVGGRATGILMEHDGTRWNLLDEAFTGLSGVHDLGDGQVVAVGERGLTVHYNRTTGALTDNLQSPTLDLLHAVWVAPSGLAWAVGGNFYTSGDFRGVVLHGELAP